MQDIIDKHKVNFRVLENWDVTYKEDSKRKNKCYWDREKKEAFIYPLTIDVDPDRYVIHELLHICQAAKRGKNWKDIEEVYVQDMTEIVFGFLKITEQTDNANRSTEQQCNIADVVGRSEQLCQHDRSVTNRICDDCGSIITYVPDELA